jgi:hypothetical protein
MFRWLFNTPCRAPIYELAELDERTTGLELC